MRPLVSVVAAVALLIGFVPPAHAQISFGFSFGTPPPPPRV